MNLAADRHPSLATCLCDSISPDIVGNFEFRENPISSLVPPENEGLPPILGRVRKC